MARKKMSLSVPVVPAKSVTSHRHGLSESACEDSEFFTNQVDKVISLSGKLSNGRIQPTPIVSGIVMTKEIREKMDRIEELLEFSKEFTGKLSLMVSDNELNDFVDFCNGKYSLRMDFDDGDEFEIDGTINECCDKAMIFLNEKLQKMRDIMRSIDSALDFLADSMLGNGELSEWEKKRDAASDDINWFKGLNSKESD